MHPLAQQVMHVLTAQSQMSNRLWYATGGLYVKYFAHGPSDYHLQNLFSRFNAFGVF